MPRSSSRPSRPAAASPVEKPATRRSLRSLASPSPKTKSSSPPASRSRTPAKSTPAAAATKSSPAAKSRSRSAAKSSPVTSPPASKSAAKSRSHSRGAAADKSPKSAKSPAAKSVKSAAAKSPAAARGRDKSAKKATPSKSTPAKASSRSHSRAAAKSPADSTAKSSPSPKKASHKKTTGSAAKKAAPRSRGKGRKEQEEEEEQKEEEQDPAEEEEEGKKTDGEEASAKEATEEGEKGESANAETPEAPEAKQDLAEDIDDSGKPELKEGGDTAAEKMEEGQETDIDKAVCENKDEEKSEVQKEAEPEKMETSEPTDACPVAIDRKRKHEDDEDEALVDSKVAKISDESNGVDDEKVAEVTEVTNNEKKSEQPEPVPQNEEPNAALNDDSELDYILISADDVPAVDSEEMLQVSAKMISTDPVCVGNGECGEDPVLSRSFISEKSVGEQPSSARCFSVVSYNILADFHAQRDYGGDAAPWISDDQLAIPARHKRLLQELLYLDADVVCLQEVGGDYMTDLLGPDMERHGYKGMFIARNTKDFNEGEATFYRCSRFSLESCESLILKDLIDTAVEESSCGLESDKKALIKEALSTYAVAMLTKLKSVATDDVLTVANIHVAYDKFKRQDRQCLQLAMTVQKMIQLAGGSEKPHIICGDFNSWPGTPAYQLMTDGNLNDASLIELQSIESVDAGDEQFIPVVNLWSEGFQFPAGGDLKSAYGTVRGTEPLTSRFSVDERVLALDYIWFSNVCLSVLGVLDVVDPELMKNGIPNTVFASDHLSLKARFAFK